MLYIEQWTMLKPYTRYIHKEKCIGGQCHLACRWELAEGDQTFRAQCESNVRRQFSFLFRIAQCEMAFRVRIFCLQKKKKFKYNINMLSFSNTCD